ncbi:DUF3168 domain-containing protein [Salinicoccus albus]|uniref:DUF3168 domain-containing protein n=1 Tax=Salinicoccus albus TaxID=418756 RepID=UPI00036FD029|nr:DUF3168 domain-containing protein [Salinicoccus albus]
MSPEQEVFTKLRMLCADLYGEENVYDYIPPSGTEYPFLMLGSQMSQNDRFHKEALGKNTQVTIHFWHDNWRERGRITKMMADVESMVLSEFGVKGEEITTQFIQDNSTNTALMHGVLETNIKLRSV